MQIGEIDLRNRFIMAPIKTGYNEGNGLVTDRHLEFYRRRAKHVGAVIPEPVYIDSRLRESPTQIGIDTDDKIEGLKSLTGVIHEGGSKAVAHLNHPGRMANPGIPDNIYFSSTDRACGNGGAKPERMKQGDIDRAIRTFQEAATRAKRANFDVVELQFGHGYLVAQFLSPRVNDREDEYGGSFGNRIRFALEVLTGVKDVVSLPVQVRISGDEMVSGGIELNEMKDFAELLEANGADAIHVSAGTVCTTPPWYFQHMFTAKGRTWEMAGEIKSRVSIPVISVGRVNSFEDIDEILKEGMSDFIAIGRALLADPDFVGKYLDEVEGEVRPCLACSDGCLGGVKSGKGLGCLMNPEVGRMEVPSKAEKERKVAVVGGGLAGMSAAVVASRRGHEVTLFERDELGGVFNLAFLPPGKETLQRGVDYFKKEVEDLGVEVMHKEAGREDLTGYDAVVLATGSKPFFPPIDGLNDYHWAEILEGENIPSEKKVMVVGGGLVGVEATKALASRGNEVVLVELLPELAGNMIGIERAQILNSFQDRSGVEVNTETNLTKIDGSTAYGERNGEELKWEGIDEYVVVTGMKSYNPIDPDDLDVPAYVVGDADEPAKAEDAIRSGYEVGLKV
ncbi:MAG: FAD-dependent oxidoreductase [Candidatus Bipolaricaulota bacterium]